MGEEYPELPAELEQLIAKVEGLEIETKETASEDVLSQFSKFCASFANTQGGSIVIGVNKAGKIVGANIDQQVMDRISSEAASCRPPVKVQLNLYHKEGRTVLQVFVPKSEYIHTDKSFRFPLRTGSVTTFMELGTILAYAKERNLVGGEPSYTYKTTERRKPEANELKPFIDGLSHHDPRVRAHALSQLSAMVFTTEVENEGRLLPRLVKLIRDPDAGVRQSALGLYAKLNYQHSPTHKAKYNKRILPLALKAVVNDDNRDVRKQALEALVATGDSRAAKVVAALINNLAEEEYKTTIPDHVWDSLVHFGLGPKLRRELFKKYVGNDKEDVRRRIEEIVNRRYMG